LTDNRVQPLDIYCYAMVILWHGYPAGNYFH
jgi:hypothetical protein